MFWVLLCFTCFALFLMFYSLLKSSKTGGHLYLFRALAQTLLHSERAEYYDDLFTSFLRHLNANPWLPTPPHSSSPLRSMNPFHGNCSPSTKVP